MHIRRRLKEKDIHSTMEQGGVSKGETWSNECLLDSGEHQRIEEKTRRKSDMTKLARVSITCAFGVTMLLSQEASAHYLQPESLRPQISHRLTQVLPTRCWSR